MKKIFALMGVTDKASFFALVAQFIRFGIVGVSNTLVHLGIFYVCMHFLGVHYLVSNVAAFIVSVLNAFFLSRRFVFGKSEKSIAVQLVKIYAAYGFSFVLSMFTLFLMVDVLGISAYIAPLINICITVPINFLVNKFWAFK
jgi:putative flippase GtrA